MYHLMVRRHARRIFERLTAGDWQPILDGLAPNVHHVYAGQNAVGGTRTSRDDVRRWFERRAGHVARLLKPLSLGDR